MSMKGEEGWRKPGSMKEERRKKRRAKMKKKIHPERNIILKVP